MKRNTGAESVSIRWITNAPGACVSCEADVGQGPVGFREGQNPGVLCDACLADTQRGLGLLLVAVNVLREFVEQADPDEEHEFSRLIKLLVFAKLYHTLESEYWPVRSTNWHSHLADLQKSYGVESLSPEMLCDPAEPPENDQ